jgi:hypothetical protein
MDPAVAERSRSTNSRTAQNLETDMPDSTCETLTLADGRVLTYDTYGDPDGLPVIFNEDCRTRP